MLRELMRHGLDADFVVGSSAGALNAAYFASAPDAAGVDKLGQIWCGLRRRDVFPVTLRSLQRFAGGEGHLIDPSNLGLLIMRAAAAMLARRLEISTVS
jgi:NTE family protein